MSVFDLCFGIEMCNFVRIESCWWSNGWFSWMFTLGRCEGQHGTYDEIIDQLRKRNATHTSQGSRLTVVLTI